MLLAHRHHEGVDDTEVFGKVEMSTARRRQDYGLWLKLLRAGDKAQAVPGTLAIYRRRSTSLSANKLQAAVRTWRVYRHMEELDLIKSSYYFMYYLVGTAWRRLEQRTARKNNHQS